MKGKKKLAFLMSFILLFTTIQLNPLSVFAAGDMSDASYEVLRFDALDDAIAKQSVAAGAEETAIVLPELLTATVRITWQEEAGTDAPEEADTLDDDTDGTENAAPGGQPEKPTGGGRPGRSIR